MAPVFAADAGVQQLIDTYRAAAEPLAQRPVGQLTAAVLRQPGPSLETPLGNLTADAQLAATRGSEQGGRRFPS
ncbi:MAG: hypothetical protein NDI95_10585 [Acidovorax soli]|nr:hypothetical protein [Acidovorax soli]